MMLLVYINYICMQNSRHEKSGSKTSCNTELIQRAKEAGFDFGKIPHAQRKQAQAGQAFTVGHYPISTADAPKAQIGLAGVAAQGEALRMLLQGARQIPNQVRDDTRVLAGFSANKFLRHFVSGGSFHYFPPFSTLLLDSVMFLYINYIYMQNSRHEKLGSMTSCNT